jgi:hypothetical protein
MGTLSHFSVKEFFGYLLFVNGFFFPINYFNTAPWSLSIEIWAYVIGALFFVKNLLSKILIVLLVAGGLYMNDLFIYSFVWFLSFAFGFWNVKMFGKGMIFLLIMGLIVNLVVLGIHFYLFKVTRIYVLSSGFSFLFFMILLLRFNVFHFQFLKGVAPYSYTWYLFHMPFLNLSKEFLFFLPRETQIVLALTIGWLLSRYLARYFENRNWVEKTFILPKTSK